MSVKKAVAIMVLGIGLLAGRAARSATDCDLSQYKQSSELEAKISGETLVVTWTGDRGQQLRMRMSIVDKTPKIDDIRILKNGVWVTLASNLTPQFDVVSGFRRITDQQLLPLRQMGVKITPEIVDKYKWDAFWDAPLYISKNGYRDPAMPPAEAFADQPGLPRKADEIHRASAVYDVQGCSVRTNGARLEISYPGVSLGVFDGGLKFTVYQGSNLIRQEVIAKTRESSVAYKYDAGMSGLSIGPKSRIVWRDTGNNWQDYEFGGVPNDGPAVLQTGNRLVAAELAEGSIAAFPPPHNFFWSREINVNLGYSWYRKKNASTFAFGVRQPESEIDPSQAGRGPRDDRENFALRSARPDTWQRMPVYFYVSPGTGKSAINSALAFTRGDHYKALPNYEVMASHFHSCFVQRLAPTGNLSGMLPDLEVAKAMGVNIYAPIDPNGSGGCTPLPGANQVTNQDIYYEIARLHSDKHFLVMPNEEVLSGDLANELGGHTDLLVSHPVFWLPTRAADQPLVESDPKRGRVYHIGGPDDFMKMVRDEDLLVFMPHPRSKGSTGYPDAIKDTPHFLDESYRGFGFRWGMGLDGSEQRLCEYRCLPLWDEVNNWIADMPTAPKYIQATSEVFEMAPGDDAYAGSPVNYVKVSSAPGLDNWKPIIDAMKEGNYFVTSGEVLIPSFSVSGTGNQRTIVADVEWTFPLEFVDVVSGDGKTVDRRVVSVTDFPPFGQHHFQIPFDATGKKWVRFAVWDSAGDGAMAQPVKLSQAPSAKSRAQ
ncbi:MAG TPA: hypothetical protein VHX49_10415 [Candidatus Acidoferrales bacterium]|nr:hypothetical protein [Candidatus Acidoferrales bacterium]